MNEMTGSAADAGGTTWKKRAVQLFAGGILGAATMYATLHFLEEGAAWDFGVDALVAMGAGVVFMLIGLIVLAGAAAPKAGKHFLEVEDEADLHYQRRELLWGGLILVMIGAVPFVLGLGGADGLVANEVALWVIVALVAAVTLLSIVIKFRRDELNDAIVKESATYTFYAIMLFFGGWAVAAHLEYLEPFPMAAFFGGAMWIWIMMIFLAAFKRGIG